MYCKQCKGEMADTGGTSFGTGDPIYRCEICGWTGLFKSGIIVPTTKPEDIFHHGIKYSDYKAVITVTGADGKPKLELTSWRADVITGMMKEGLALQAFEPGDTFTVTASPKDVKPDEVNT